MKKISLNILCFIIGFASCYTVFKPSVVEKIVQVKVPVEIIKEVPVIEYVTVDPPKLETEIIPEKEIVKVAPPKVKPIVTIDPKKIPFTQPWYYSRPATIKWHIINEHNVKP